MTLQGSGGAASVPPSVTARGSNPLPRAHGGQARLRRRKVSP